MVLTYGHEERALWHSSKVCAGSRNLGASEAQLRVKENAGRKARLRLASRSARGSLRRNSRDSSWPAPPARMAAKTSSEQRDRPAVSQRWLGVTLLPPRGQGMTADLKIGLMALTWRASSGGGRLPTRRFRPPLCASKLSFLHLAVIEEDRAYDSKGSVVTCRDR